MLNKLLCTLTIILLGAACQGRVGYSYGYEVTAPELVYVSPGVQVVADYDYPVFYADNVYWRYDGGVWYRSPRYSGGWTVSTNVPVAVRRIDRPAAYVHYRGSARVAGPYRHDMGRDHRGEPRSNGRDHRR